MTEMHFNERITKFSTNLFNKYSWAYFSKLPLLSWPSYIKVLYWVVVWVHEKLNYGLTQQKLDIASQYKDLDLLLFFSKTLLLKSHAFKWNFLSSTYSICCGETTLWAKGKVEKALWVLSLYRYIDKYTVYYSKKVSCLNAINV